MKRFFILIGGIILLMTLVGNSIAMRKNIGQESVAAEKVADFIHAILEADRTLYTTHVVQRMQENNVVKVEEAWKRATALPLPAQMLALSGQRVKSKGIGLEHRLISLWPIYEKNRPRTKFELTGLKAITTNPNKPYIGTITKDGKKFFQAIYADTAVSHSCVDCHNAHALSPKQDYKLNDVMGGLIISFPLL